MEYVNLGNTGLKVSRFCLGINTSTQGQDHATKMVKLAFDSGVNLFDTAEMYGAGEGERQMGIALKALNVPREDYVVFTKIFWGAHSVNTNSQNVVGTSRKHLVEGLQRSLNSLQLQYVDVVFCHRYDHTTPIVEVCQAMKTILESGKAFYWATSDWPAIRIMEAIHVCDKIGCPRPITDQCEYSMLEITKIELDYAPLIDDYKYGTTIWSPLASGILTGKYNNGIPAGSRFDTNKWYTPVLEKWFGENVKEKTVQTLQALQKIAEELGCKLSQLALAWTIANKDVSSCIVGATSEAQLAENLAALPIKAKITPEIEKRIEAILQNAPTQEKNYLTWQQLPGRRGF